MNKIILENSAKSSCFSLRENTFDPLFSEIAKYYELRFTEVKSVLNHVVSASKKTCSHKMVSGNNKGKHCDAIALENGYCKKHQNSAVKLAASTGPVSKGTENKKVVISKTRQQIIDWLSTAVPQEETILKRMEDGNLINEETEIMFDDDFMVIGRLNGKKGDVIKLSRFEIEICEKKGWRYHESCVGSDVDEALAEDERSESEKREEVEDTTEEDE